MGQTLSLVQNLGSARNVAAVFYHLFGVMTKIELRRAVGRVVSDYAKNGYVCRNCKLYIYAYTKNQKIRASDYGVNYVDVPLLKNIAASLEIPSKCRPLTLCELTKNENYLCEELRPYIGKFVSKKMAFLMKSYALPRHDLESDLMVAALHAFHKRYPFFESELYAINVCKSAIHNAGMDIINKYTSPKYSRLNQLRHGLFEHVHVGVDALKNVEAPQPYGGHYADESRSLRELEVKIPKRAARFISLARGDFDKDFSKYLGVEDNTAVADRAYKTYLNSVYSYLGINTKAQREQLMKSLRRHL